HQFRVMGFLVERMRGLLDVEIGENAHERRPRVDAALTRKLVQSVEIGSAWSRHRRARPLVSRFRSSPEFAARSEANFGIEGHQPFYESSAALNPKFAIGLAAMLCELRVRGTRRVYGPVTFSSRKSGCCRRVNLTPKPSSPTRTPRAPGFPSHITPPPAGVFPLAPPPPPT